jgi:kumamolisin
MQIPQIHPYFKKAHPARVAQARASGAGPWSVAALCAAYSWPTNLVGGGVIAIVELGGGWTQADMQAYFTSNGLPMPTIVDVSVDGTQNAPGSDADGEVALDIQVSAAAYSVATGKAATIRIYWAADIAPAVRRAAADGCAVCSISWGADEADWGAAAATDMEQAAIEAAAAGMVVFAASGDNDSSDGGSTPANVDVPASCPHVIGCGGTVKTRSTEGVWNDTPGRANGDGTGGGYSTIFPMPQWQISGGAPKGPGRMVPDVAADADPSTGYEIYYGGSSQVVGGTSAVAPLYSGLFAAFGTKLGFVGDALWGNEACFTDITVGDNGLYHASVGADPCTGLGAPDGEKLATLFVASLAPGHTPVPTNPPTPPIPPTPSPTPSPVGVTLAQAIAWAEARVPDDRMSRHTVEHFVKRGLKANWPSGVPGVTLGLALEWAVSQLPDAHMTLAGARHHIEQGLRTHWPSGTP